MLGIAELPIAILAWFLVALVLIGILGVISSMFLTVHEKVSFERESKRREQMRKRAMDNIINMK